MSTFRMELDISPAQLRKYYGGRSQTVRAKSVDGRIVEFPANILRAHLTHQGVQGLFELEVDEANRVVKINKLYK